MAGTHFGGRTLARSQAMQLLFQAEATGRLVSEVLMDTYALDEGELDDYARELALGADAMEHELDAIIAATSSNWSLSRISAVDRNLLRIALYEMLRVDEVDVAVAIDECVELERAYGSTDTSFRFANGVLGKVAREIDEGIDVIAVSLEIMAREEAARAAAEAAEAAKAAEEAAAAAAEAGEVEADEADDAADEVHDELDDADELGDDADEPDDDADDADGSDESDDDADDESDDDPDGADEDDLPAWARQ